MGSPYVLVWLLFVLAWAANFVIRVGFSALLPAIIQDLRLSYAAAGVLASAFFWAYIVAQIPSGLLGDRFGRRRVLVWGLLGAAAATAATGLAGSFAALVMARIATGAGQGAMFSNDRAIIAAVTPRERIGLGQAVSFTGPGLGITLGLVLGGMLTETFSWRTVLFVFALGPLAAGVAIARWVPHMPPSADTAALWSRLRGVARMRGIWALGAMGACGIAVQFVLATWAPMFFLETGVRGLGRAGALAGLQGIAAVAGLITAGWLADRLVKRGVQLTTVIATSLVILGFSMAAMAAALRRGSPLEVAATLAGAAFFVWAVWGPVYSLLGILGDEADLAAAFGLFNTICFVGAIVGPALVGWIRDVSGTFAWGCAVTSGIAFVGAGTALSLRGPRSP